LAPSTIAEPLAVYNSFAVTSAPQAIAANIPVANA
jgi:hypothetical protein